MRILCAEMKKRIPLSWLGELSPAEQIELETHLLNCSLCAVENSSYADTFAQLRTLSDDSAPRHFLVYPVKRRQSPKELWDACKLGWKLAFGAGLISIFLLFTLFLTEFQLRVENGVYSLSFGNPVAPISSVVKNREDKINPEWMEFLDARSRQDRQELNTLVKQELADYTRGLSAQQKKEWQSALSHLEKRLTKKIDGNVEVLHSGMRQSVGEMYQTVQSQRFHDRNRTRIQLDRLAQLEDQKDQETKEILATLLQVTDIKLK